jgi:hypothetical protein
MESTLTSSVDEEEIEDETSEEDDMKVGELQKISVIETVMIALIVAIIVSSLFYLTNASLSTDIDQFWYYFAFLIVPAGCFLLMLHTYSLYETFTTKKRVIPFVLDATYLLYLIPSFVTIFFLGARFDAYGISYKLFSLGWFIAVGLLFVEVAITFECARYLTLKVLPNRFPHVIPTPKQQELPRLKNRFQKPQKNMVYFIRKKSNTTKWEQQDSFVRLHP